MKNIGDNIKRIRKEQNMYQTELCKLTGFVQAYISRVENNQIVPTVISINKFAQALGCTLNDLLEDTDSG